MTRAQQSIKIITEIIVNMNIVDRIKLSCNLKNSSSEVGYYSYTNRYISFTDNKKEARVIPAFTSIK